MKLWAGLLTTRADPLLDKQFMLILRQFCSWYGLC